MKPNEAFKALMDGMVRTERLPGDFVFRTEGGAFVGTITAVTMRGRIPEPPWHVMPAKQAVHQQFKSWTAAVLWMQAMYAEGVLGGVEVGAACLAAPAPVTPGSGISSEEKPDHKTQSKE